MTKLLDLDAIAAAVVLTVTLGGVQHQMKVPSVKELATLIKEVESLSLSATMSTELDMMINVLDRSYPTIGRDALEALTIDQIRQLFQFTQNAIVGNVEKEDDQGNAPAAN